MPKSRVGLEKSRENERCLEEHTNERGAYVLHLLKDDRFDNKQNMRSYKQTSIMRTK